MTEEEVEQSKQQPKKKRTLLQRIVNVFLYIGLALFICFVMFFAISQTQLFKNWLRDFVVDLANENLNGKISIEKIEGTIFTSLILRNTVVTMSDDTLLNAGKIELRTSPLKIFLKTIYVRKAEIQDARISFIQDSSGELNISKLFPPPDEEEDTSKSSFPFRIEVADFKLSNVDFSIQNYTKKSSKEYYSTLNMEDLRVNDIYLSLKAFADIDYNTFEAKLEHLSLSPNIKSFNLNSLSGEFGINPKEIIANNLLLNTSNSDVGINAKVNGINLFDSTVTEDLKYALMDISVNSTKFNFDDLSAFVPVDMLKGAVGFQLNASGNLQQMDVNKIIIDYGKTHLETSTVIKNIHNIDEMRIATKFKNSSIYQPDINKLLPSIGIPVFEKLGIVKIDSLSFDGKPLNFESKILLSTNDGKVSSDVRMNFEKPVTEYDINFTITDFNLQPIANLATDLNLKGHFIGKGFSPSDMNSNIILVGDGSAIEGITLDSLSLTAKANEGVFDFSLLTETNNAVAAIDGSLDFLKENLGYKISGAVNHLDIGKILNDSLTFTDLNFNFRTEGENFDIDKMNMFLTFDISPSVINGVKIDSLRTITDIYTDNNDDRVISFISDIADITLKGKFSLPDIISVLSKESSLLTQAFMNKTEEFFPSSNPEEETSTEVKPEKGKHKNKSANDEEISILYLVDFKDFGIISPFLQNKRLEIDGDLSGEIKYNSDSIHAALNSNLNYIKYWGSTDVYFLSKMVLGADLKNSFNAHSTEDIKLNLQTEAKRIFAGSDMNNIYLNLDLNKNVAAVDIGANLENLASAKLSGLIDMHGSQIKLDIDRLNLVYNEFDIYNKEQIKLVLSPERIDFNNFQLYHSEGKISFNGFLSSNQEQELKLSADNISAKDIILAFFKETELGFLDMNLNLNGEIRGNYSSPRIDLVLNGLDLTYKGKNFGDLISNFKYSNKVFSSDIKFFDSFSGTTDPSLKVSGLIPVNLSLTDSGKRLITEEEINVNLVSNNLDLAPFGELIPGVSKFKGKLNSDLQINGTFEELHPKGYVKLDNSTFLLDYNNLEYKAGINLSVSNDMLSLENLLLANLDDTKDGGTITGGGTAVLKNFSMTSSEFAFNGSLKVLSEESKYVSPNLYGDLVISTDGNFDLKFDKNGAVLKAPINIDVAKLTYSQAQGSYRSTSENFIYKFVEDTITKNSSTMDFESLVNLSKLNNAKEIQKKSKPSKFDYSIDVKVEDEAVFTYILSREFNQNLVAVLRGKFQYESIGGKPVAQGELELLEGSTLEFIKTLNAEGKIRFESELSNPYLDLTAIYKNYYYPETNNSGNGSSQSSSDEVEVAIKMKIRGSLNELDKNLSHQSDKLSVYIGAKSIENNEADETKDASDAVMFMLLGKFKDDAITQQDKLNVSSYATSFAGSLVGGFLNRQLGDYVKSLEIRQSGTDTKFILAGRAGKFRYSIGGSTAVFQDLGLANVKIEYPITRNFFMRLERKEALSETQYINEMINELGLKYRFEF